MIGRTVFNEARTGTNNCIVQSIYSLIDSSGTQPAPGARENFLGRCPALVFHSLSSTISDSATHYMFHQEPKRRFPQNDRVEINCATVHYNRIKDKILKLESHGTVQNNQLDREMGD